MPHRSQDSLITALKSDNLAAVEAAVHEHPESIEAPNRRPPITWSQSQAAVDLLLAHGANLAAVSEWWAPGFGARDVPEPAAQALVGHGAAVTAHAAAGLGLRDKLSQLLKADPSLVDAKGGDGCTPLHFARDVKTARLLLDAAANLEARDEDHDSTPVQWLIGGAPDVVRFLLDRGAAPDIFLAAALGDRSLAERLIDADPHCPGHRIGRLPEFPPIGHKGRGGSIYQWTLGFNSFPQQIATKRGHADLATYLWDRSGPRTRLLVACVTANRPEAENIARAHPEIVPSLDEQDLELPARYCWETNTNYEAVKLMLDLGFPVAHPEHNHGFTPLHNAAWAGSGDLVELLIERGHPLDLEDPKYHATPLGWAVDCCTVEKRHPDADYGRVARALAKAGAPLEGVKYPTGDVRLDEALAPYLGAPE